MGQSTSVLVRALQLLRLLTFSYLSNSQKGAQQVPTFWPMSIVAKWSPILATAEHLLWPPYVIGGPLYFCPVVSFLPSFFLLLFFPRLISAAVDRMSAILLHMAWP